MPPKLKTEIVERSMFIFLPDRLLLLLISRYPTKLFLSTCFFQHPASTTVSIKSWYYAWKFRVGGEYPCRSFLNSNATLMSSAKRWVTGTATPVLPITAED